MSFMRNDRPSIGEFHGAFNLNDKDYKKLYLSIAKRLNIDHPLPKLTIEEVNQLRDQVRCVFSHWKEAASIHLINFLGPLDYFVFDEEGQSDRTLNVNLSSARGLQLVDVLRLQDVLCRGFNFWRIVLRLPAGPAPDVTIYRDHYIAGDIDLASEIDFSEFLKASVEAETYSVSRHKQLQVLLDSNSWTFLDEERSIVRAPFLDSALGDFEDLNATIWLGVKHGPKSKVQFAIRKVKIGEHEYRKSVAFNLYGTLDKNRKWTIQTELESSWIMLPFPVLRDCQHQDLTVCGFDNLKQVQWEATYKNL